MMMKMKLTAKTHVHDFTVLKFNRNYTELDDVVKHCTSLPTGPLVTL